MQQAKVIRILKSSKNDEIINVADQRSHLEKVRLFQQTHLLPHFERFIRLPKIISLSKYQVGVLNQVASSKRPPSRLNKNLPARECYALLLPDFCQITNISRFGLHLPHTTDVVAVELKPKQGFLPLIDALTYELSIKSKISRFCLKQYHKQRRG